jgi:hypoxanthine phosphoribosyltransferase
VPWEYEPKSFPISWDKDQKPNQYFTPDFYLPDDDLFIEITTMSQKLVTKKNRKVRHLKELHPEINCKVFYQRDYLNLVVKYGLEEPENLEDVTAPTRIPGRPDIVRLEERGERLTG